MQEVRRPSFGVLPLIIESAGEPLLDLDRHQDALKEILDSSCFPESACYPQPT
jgi:hypothetical protein